MTNIEALKAALLSVKDAVAAVYMLDPVRVGPLHTAIDHALSLCAALAQAEQPELTECADNDSPWLVCKPCAAAGRCKQAEQAQPEPITLADVLDALNVFNKPRPGDGDEPWTEEDFISVKHLPAFLTVCYAAWYAAPPAAPLKAEQAQPVAPLIAGLSFAEVKERIALLDADDLRGLVLSLASQLRLTEGLLAAPPAAQPLTDADIEAVMGPCEGSAFAEHLRRESVKSFKRVYFKLHPERAHGIAAPAQMASPEPKDGGGV